MPVAPTASHPAPVHGPAGTPARGRAARAAAGTAFLALALALALPARADVVSLGVAENFNAFALGNFASTYSDTEGAVAVAGQATLVGYSINALNQAGQAGNVLVVGGNLDFRSGSINHGNAVVGGSIRTAQLGGGASVRQGEAPFSFAAAAEQLGRLSTALVAATANGRASFNGWGGVTFVGDGSDQAQVFNVAGSQLLRLNDIRFSGLSQGQTLIFNVSGATAGFQSVGLYGFSGYNVLFNFHDATSLVLNGVGVYGSILAPKATVSGGNGQVNGNVVVKDWNSSIQINDNHLFEPVEVATLALAPATDAAAPLEMAGPTMVLTAGAAAPASAIPEPGTLALVLPLLLVPGLAAARRRRGGRPAGQP